MQLIKMLIGPITIALMSMTPVLGQKTVFQSVISQPFSSITGKYISFNPDKGTDKIRVDSDSTNRISVKIGNDLFYMDRLDKKVIISSVTDPSNKLEIYKNKQLILKNGDIIRIKNGIGWPIKYVTKDGIDVMKGEVEFKKRELLMRIYAADDYEKIILASLVLQIIDDANKRVADSSMVLFIPY